MSEDQPRVYHLLLEALREPPRRCFDALTLCRGGAGWLDSDEARLRDALAAGTPEWPVPLCIADAESLLSRMRPAQRCLCLATGLRLVVEASSVLEVSDPGGLMLPAICEAFEQRAQRPGEPETRFVPMESVDQVPSALLRRTMLYCMQLLIAEAQPGLVAKLVGQLGRLARQDGLEHFFPLWWARCRQRLAFQAAATATLA